MRCPVTITVKDTYTERERQCEVEISEDESCHSGHHQHYDIQTQHFFSWTNTVDQSRTWSEKRGE